MNEDILEICKEKAIETIKKCATTNGFFASGGKDGYNAVWSRDSMITSLGASLFGFKETFKASIKTLAENQSKNGQIPNAVDKWSERKSHIDFKTIDSTLWFLIGIYIYQKRFNEKGLTKKYKKNIGNALRWLGCQDSGENGLLTQLPTSDWQDAFPHKYGYTINTQALYYFVLNLIGKKKNAEGLKKIVNENKEDSLWLGEFYAPYRWKNHNKYKEVGDWFDSLGNLLAIVFGLADEERAIKIISYIKKNKINQPSSIKCIFPTIDTNSKYWQDYFLDCEAGTPNSYANGGIWGYIGCFYVLSLIKLKKFREAEEELRKIAEVNFKFNFPEWVHPIKNIPGENSQYQAWEAGMYLLAYESLKRKRVLI